MQTYIASTPVQSKVEKREKCKIPAIAVQISLLFFTVFIPLISRNPLSKINAKTKLIIM